VEDKCGAVERVGSFDISVVVVVYVPAERGLAVYEVVLDGGAEALCSEGRQ
jgi:hypothetical protein